MALPLARLPWVKAKFWYDDDPDAPLALGYLQFFESNSSTPLEVYSDPDGNTSLGSEVDLNAAGVPTSSGNTVSIFIKNEGYRLRVFDADDVEQFGQSGDYIQDPGAVAFNNFGTITGAGARNESSYTPDNDDFFITVDGDVTLQAAEDRTQDLTIQNVGASAIDVTPDGSQTINGVSGAYELASGTAPAYPTITLSPQTGGYFIRSTAFL